VEAAENSGSLITARLAMEQNREVFAVLETSLHAIHSARIYLIKGAGAKLVQQWQDVASELPAEIAAQLLPPPSKKKKKGELVDQLQLARLDLNENETRDSSSCSRPTRRCRFDSLAENDEASITQLTLRCSRSEMRN
jgi:DNA processing protein